MRSRGGEGQRRMLAKAREGRLRQGSSGRYMEADGVPVLSGSGGQGRRAGCGRVREVDVGEEQMVEMDGRIRGREDSVQTC